MSSTTPTFQIDDPIYATQCSSVTLHWAGGTPPYNITVGGFEKTIANFPALTNYSITWVANVTAGTPLVFYGYDGNGNDAHTNIFVMAPGTSDSCLQVVSAHNSMGALSVGAIAGVAIAAAAVGIAVVILIAWTHRRRRRGDWRKRAEVDLNASSLPPAQPQPPSKALMMQRGLSSGSVEAGSDESSSSDLAAVSVSAQVGESSPRVVTHIGEPRVDPKSSVSTLPNIRGLATERDLSQPPASAGGSLAPPQQAPSDSSRPSRGINETRILTHALDGGVRLAGGPFDTPFDDEAASTLPPPYRRY